MLRDKSQKYKNFILFQFTKELINNSKNEYTKALERIRKEKIKDNLSNQNIPRMKTKIVLSPLKKKQENNAIKENNNFGKIENLMRDKSVHRISCDGPGVKIKIRKKQEEELELSLNSEEIKEIIRKFFDLANTPLGEGMVTSHLKTLTIRAIYSERSIPKFIIIRN